MSMTAEQKRVFDVFTTKPAWMKEATLTKRGWTNPKTGELLLGRRTPDWVFEEIEKLSAVEDVVSEPEAPVETAAEDAAATEAVVEEKVEEDTKIAVETPAEEAPKATKTSRRSKKG